MGKRMCEQGGFADEREIQDALNSIPHASLSATCMVDNLGADGWMDGWMMCEPAYTGNNMGKTQMPRKKWELNLHKSQQSETGSRAALRWRRCRYIHSGKAFAQDAVQLADLPQ